MVTFILNDETISTGKPSGSSLLDFIRYDMGLTGTKTGCREGDCGACTVLVGTAEGNRVTYSSAVSCLMPLVNAHGRHIVTVEGINTGKISAVQRAIVDHSATQCGFCTPGIVMSLTAESLAARKTTPDSAIASVSGNICRCTGYKSVERAVETIASALADKDLSDPVRWLVDRGELPAYFLSIAERLSEIPPLPPEPAGVRGIGGGTDLMVQKADLLAESDSVTYIERKVLKGIRTDNGRCIIGAAVTTSEMGRSELLKRQLPELSSYIQLIASEPVRNMATIGGNIVNASPIGDISVMLLALNADVTLTDGRHERTVPLKDLFLAYKKLDMKEGEYIRHISFICSDDPPLYSFEKVSRRTHLDIASVNSALSLKMSGDTIGECHLSAGGVSPVPLCLKKTAEFLTGRTVSAETLMQANDIIQEEISPISDVRGSEEYKRLLLRQLFLAHFLKHFPGSLNLSIEEL
ncbi:MAG: FAD binding domain-containing protein [Bacteroidales bacterium]|jgi:xanthine dehydrogenase small subunit|nr:FAD binding domain-containing protein [Bacteroidales bacterium]